MTTINAFTDLTNFTHDYVAVWNEPNPDVREAAICRLWAQDAVEFIETNEYRGHDQLVARVAAAYEEFVGGAGMLFSSAGDVVGHHGLVRFTVTMGPAEGGPDVWTGFVVIALDEDGRIIREHQFANPPRPTESTQTHYVIKEMLSRFGSGDHQGAAALFAETVDWQLSWPDGDNPPWIRDRTTRAEMAEHFRTLSTLMTPNGHGFVIGHVLVDGPHAVVAGRSSQRVNATGRSFELMVALHMTVEDGLITRYHVYEDSLAVARAAQPQVDSSDENGW